MKHLSITVYNNFHKPFKILSQPGKSIIDIVNENLDEPRKQGIPFICLKGACRGCTVHVLEGAELLEPPSKLEQRALQVGKTTIASGYRLACMAKFKKDPSL